MPNFSQISLQKAIYQKLTGDSTLMAMITGVFDRPPQGTAYPYIVLGDSVGSDWSTKTSNGTQQMVTLQVWSREGGRKEAGSVMERLYSLLHEGSLTVTGQTLVCIQFIASSILLADDGWSYQGLMRFRILLESSS